MLSGVFRFSFSSYIVFIRKVKDAWDNKRDTLVKSGTFAIEQLAEALSAGASSNKLPDGLAETALRLCAEQVSSLWNFVNSCRQTLHYVLALFPNFVELQ